MKPTPSDHPAVDRQIIERAVKLGRLGWGRVRPNPMVGCVLVRNGAVVGEGWHEEYGGPHAEVVALAKAGSDAKGATAYVSLEPCRHHGKTPPCTEALRDAGISRVVFGAEDPGHDSGGGAAVLVGFGVEVLGPLLSLEEARRENPGFHDSREDRPWVALKLATSLDGRISARAGLSSRISGPESNERVHWLRAGFEGIMVGTRTALTDDPRLSVRGANQPRTPPKRVILDPRGQVPASARVLDDADGTALFFTTASSPTPWRSAIEARGGRILEVPAEGEARLSLLETLRALRGEGIRTLLCEGGGVIGSRLLQQGLVDRFYLVLAPKLLGSDGVPAFPSHGSSSRGLTDGGPGPLGEWTLIEDPLRLGNDVWMVLEPKGG